MSAVHLGTPGIGAEAPANLPIAGVSPLSTVDWPGQLVATVFVQGCPWRCTYCHNTSLLDCRIPGSVPFEEVLELLRRRRGLLDGVVFSGGEATRHPALPAAMRVVRELGYGVGLHTGGAYPARLREISDLVTWVGFDVKGLPEDYPRVAGAPIRSGERAWTALGELAGQRQDGTPEIEVRLTVYPGSHSVRAVRECASRARDLGAQGFALQQARDASSGTPMAAPDGAAPAEDDGERAPSFDELVEAARVVWGADLIVRRADA
ncbi:MAG: anaerobic ribonucleoside-triphosphate reductase activating protein [Bowdeniella nasicola]|nr:anaerobic ribonucleoside-triphosphate reductase activating protein [Bowdeniella nasicola]